MSAVSAGRSAPRRTAPAGPAVRIPISPRALRRWTLRGVALLLTAAAAAALWAARVPHQAADRALAATVASGLELRRVDIAGRLHQPEGPVRAAAYVGASTAMLDTNPIAVRARLLELPWVADATVARRFPDTLAITLVERKPAALWQHRRRLALVDASGHVLTRGDLAKFARLPLVVGPDAHRELASLTALLATAPTIAPKMDNATWVGRRRWDLRMTTGETLALPEGYARAEAALARFAALHAERPLLGRGFVRFDLRLPGKMVVRVSNAPGATAPPETRI